MAASPPRSPAADRNLLFGVLALQMDFVNRDALVRAMNAWVLDKHRPRGAILREQGALPADAHALLEALVAKHLDLHSDDPQQSLASLSPLGPARRALQDLADPELKAMALRPGGTAMARHGPWPTTSNTGWRTSRSAPGRNRGRSGRGAGRGVTTRY